MSTPVDPNLIKLFAGTFETNEVKQLYYALDFTHETDDKQQLIFNFRSYAVAFNRYKGLLR